MGEQALFVVGQNAAMLSVTPGGTYRNQWALKD
jgi:hypothetical protein